MGEIKDNVDLDKISGSTSNMFIKQYNANLDKLLNIVDKYYITKTYIEKEELKEYLNADNINFGSQKSTIDGLNKMEKLINEFEQKVNEISILLKKYNNK